MPARARQVVIREHAEDRRVPETTIFLLTVNRFDKDSDHGNSSSIVR